MINRVVAIFMNTRGRCRKVIDLLSGISYAQHTCVLISIVDLFTVSSSFKVINSGRERVFLDMWITRVSFQIVILWQFFRAPIKCVIMQRWHQLSHEKRRNHHRLKVTREGHLKLNHWPLKLSPLEARSQDLQLYGRQDNQGIVSLLSFKLM